MIHHVSVDVSELAASARFYDAVLGSLGWRRHIDGSDLVAWGIVRPVFFASAKRGAGSESGHVCFDASGIPAVKAALRRVDRDTARDAAWRAVRAAGAAEARVLAAAPEP